MQFRSQLAKRFIPGCLLCVAGAVLVAGSLPAAAEDARFVPAKRPAQKAAAPAPRATVRVISVPPECPADDNEAMNAMRAFIDPTTGELRAADAGRGSGAGPRPRTRDGALRPGAS